MARHTKILARSFAGGEMSPEMFSRLDDAMFQAGAETLLNCIPKPTGAVSRRSGTRLIRETRGSVDDKIAHLLSFVFSPAQSAVIEASRATIGGLDSGYFRFHTNGGTLLFTQPDRFKPSVETDGASATFRPIRTVVCNVNSTMTVTLVAHGLGNGDQVRFVGQARTLPGDATNPPILNQDYYVVNKTNDTFELEKDIGGVKIGSDEHAGFKPVLFNGTVWKTVTAANQTIGVSEHRIQNKEAVTITMWPDSNNPVVFFQSTSTSDDFSSFLASPVPTTGYFIGLAKTKVCAQQVMFVPDAGATLPSRIEEGRLYWTLSYATTGFVIGWQISETFAGPPLNMGDGGSGVVRLCAMPETLAGSLGAQGAFHAMRRYFAIVNDDTEPNTLKLETSIGEGQVAGGGLSFNPDARGVGPFRIHGAHELGDILSFADDAGGIRSFYAQKNWLEPQFERDRDVMTEEIHESDGSRVPGSGQRTSLTQAAYWREMAGRTTGGAVPMKPREFTGSGDLTIDSIDGDHGFETDMPISFVAGETPVLAAPQDVYFVIRVSATQIKLSLSFAGPAILGPTGPEPRNGGVLMEAWVGNGSLNHILWPSHGLSNGDTVVFSESEFATATIHIPLVLGTVYYIREETTNQFRVSASAAGPLIDITTGGSAVAAIGNGIYEVPHDYSEEELPKIGTTQSGDVMTLASQDHPVTELRRLSSEKWETVEPEFVAAAAIPGANFEVLVEQGEGTKIIETQIEGGRHRYVTNVEHQFQAGTQVYVDEMKPVGVSGGLAAGYYIVGWPSGQSSYEDKVYLQEVESNAEVQHGGLNTGLDGRIRYGTQGEERTYRYVVTAVDQNNEESAPNDPIEVDVNLFVSGAFATIGWSASSGAIRYRIYKEISGLFGLIGETDGLEFKDDNIGPDLAVSPPILDLSLRDHSRINFNDGADTVTWLDHGLVAGTPVVFRTSDQMPNVEEGKTYYVINPGFNEFQITEDPDSETVFSITGTDLGKHTAVSGNFPSTATYFEGRRVFGGSRVRPQDLWMTASGTESDLSYSIPTVDSDRIYSRIASREVSAIRHLVPLSQLVLLSDSTEYRLTPLNDDALTPSSISVRPQSFVGAGFPAPSLVNNTVVFAAARGGHMRELGYSRDVLGYLTGDLSIRAAHLFDGFTIKDQAYSKAPLPVVWCVSSSGKLLGITYIPEENVGAWHQHTTPGGTFESVTVVPEGDEDAIYVVVKRGSKRYVERFADEFRGNTADLPDAFFVDCGLTYDSGADTTLTVAGLDHLEGQTVSYLADGLPGTGLVTAGVLTLTKLASKIHVGLGFTTKIKTLPLSMMRVDAFGTGRQKNVVQVWVRIFQSGAFKAGPTETSLRSSLSPAAGVLADGIVQVTLPGDWDDDGQVFVQQDTPLPLTVAGLTIEVASGG